jgi:extradiol dioxygenase family protein
MGLAFDIAGKDCLMLVCQCLLEDLFLARQQIYAELVGMRNQVTAGTMVTFDKLGHQLLDTSLRHAYQFREIMQTSQDDMRKGQSHR